MARHEVQFPTAISYGSSGGPGHSTIYLDAKGGSQTRVGRWGAALRTWNAQAGVKSAEDARELIEFVIAREGGLHSFRFLDHADYSTDATRRGTPDFEDVVIGTGNGTQTQFQLISKYTNGSSTRTRNLQAPVAASVKAGTNGTEGTEGVDWSVDTTTGIVTFAVAPTSGHTVTAGCQFDCVAHFGQGIDAVLSVNIDAFDVRSVPNIAIVEDPSTVPVDDEMHWGGGAALAFAIPTQITSQGGRAWALTPSAATDLILPSASQQESGGPHFFLANLSGTHTITVKSGGSTIGTIAANATKTACVFLVGGSKVWRIF